MSDYIEHHHTNPNGETVTIWLHRNTPPAVIGAGTHIGEQARIGAGVSIGRWVSIGEQARIGEGVRIGSWTRIGKEAVIGERAHIGDSAGTHIGEGVRIGKEAVIGDGASIGEQARIGEGVRIGSWARIGAGDDTPFPIYLSPLPESPNNYYITIAAKGMAIGCQYHPLAEWFTFDDERILQMDGRQALKFWRRYKPLLQTIATDAGWLPGDTYIVHTSAENTMEELERIGLVDTFGL